MLSAPADWATWTGVLGEITTGMWPKFSDKTDINSTDSPKARDILATGDDFGFVKLFKFPCPGKDAKHKKFAGHSAHVTTVRFTHDDSYLISTGGGDNSIFQWKVQK